MPRLRGVFNGRLWIRTLLIQRYEVSPLWQLISVFVDWIEILQNKENINEILNKVPPKQFSIRKISQRVSNLPHFSNLDFLNMSTRHHPPTPLVVTFATFIAPQAYFFNSTSEADRKGLLWKGRNMAGK